MKMNGNVVAANNNNTHVSNGNRSESVSRNSCTPSLVNENVPAAKACNGVAVNGNGPIDLLDQPYGNIERALSAKIRNLEKRRLKLQQKSEAASKGAALSNEQREALSKAGEVEQQIEYVKDLTRLLEKQQKLYQRARKEALRKKNVKTAIAPGNGTFQTAPPNEADMPTRDDANITIENDEQPKITTEEQAEFQLEQPKSELVQEAIIELPTMETPVNKNTNAENCENLEEVPTEEQLESEQTLNIEEKAIELVVTQHNEPPEAAQIDDILTQNVEQMIENDEAPSENVIEPTQKQPVCDNAAVSVQAIQQPVKTISTEIDNATEQAHDVVPPRTDVQNRRHNPHYRRNGPYQGRQQNYNDGKNFYERNSRPRYHNNQRNSEYYSNDNTENSNGDASAESGEGGFVKPTTFVRRRKVEGCNNENNTVTNENSEVTQNVHRNGYPNGRSTYRKHRAHQENGSENNAPVMENDKDKSGGQNENDGYVQRNYNNNSNGYRGPTRHYNENGRLFRPRPNYNNGGNRNYGNNNNERKDRSHYYKQTATHRQPLECGFVFSATTD